MVASSKTFAAMIALAALSAKVNGHGYMSDPAVEFTITGDTTQFMATIESSASGFSGTFSSDPATNTASFTTAFDASDYTSLREFVEDLGQLVESDFTITCGYTNPNETAQALPDTYVEWAHTSTEGFTSSHEGPCEVWCDETRVFKDTDCAANYTTAPAQLPYDRDACLGASQLSFYWLALHSSTWQVYINCAALEATTSTGAVSSYAVSGSGSSTASTTSTTSTASSASASAATTSTASSASAAATTTSTTSTAASESSDEDFDDNDTTGTTTTTAPSTASSDTSASTEEDFDDNDTTGTTTTTTTTTAPATTTATPTTTTATPTTTSSTSKCSVRRRN
jgi:hypothetical protein